MLSLSLAPVDNMLVATDQETNHSVRVPFSINGLRVLKAMLQAQDLVINGERKIASSSMPTQQMVDAFLKNRELERDNESKAKLNELEDLF